ncbi:MAG: phosphodiester glycosidase family protein [Anaerolineae bacterium]
MISKAWGWGLGGSTLLLFCAAMTVLWTPTPLPTPTPTSTSTPWPTSTSPTLTPEITDTGWLPSAAGMERRHLLVPTDYGTEQVTVVRLAPKGFTTRVRLSPGDPHTVQAWSAATDALLTVNAGYFTQAYEPLGLVIADGVPHGTSYADFAGMFAVTAAGEMEVRWLREQPYHPNEGLRQAVQSFPVLVKPGGVMGFPEDADDGRIARRTVVAQDSAGRVLFLIAPRGYFSLHALATWLVASDLKIDVALNLDGGTSAGLWLAETPAAQINSLIGVPAVITLDPLP